MWRKLAILLEMIKFQHTVFAMPFALMGAFLAARGLPGVRVFFWVILAMVGARTCAMTLPPLCQEIWRGSQATIWCPRR